MALSALKEMRVNSDRAAAKNFLFSMVSPYWLRPENGPVVNAREARFGEPAELAGVDTLRHRERGARMRLDE
jgi:hypothetical protein